MQIRHTRAHVPESLTQPRTDIQYAPTRASATLCVNVGLAGVTMKRYPQCNRVEADDALIFCRADGTPLVRERSYSCG